MTLPKQIYIIRHGEKPDDRSIPDLSIQGLARAHYLINYWKNQNLPNPDIIYCFRNGHGLRNRSNQVMTPLSIIHNIKINSEFKDDKEEKEMVDHVMKNNANQIVLICWEHNNIPLVVKFIYDILAEQDIDKNIMKNNLKYWSLDPENGVTVKSKSKSKSPENDHDLYSLTLSIDVESKQLTGLSQSNNFLNNVHLTDEPV